MGFIRRNALDEASESNPPLLRFGGSAMQPLRNTPSECARVLAAELPNKHLAAFDCRPHDQTGDLKQATRLSRTGIGR
jgi:hypothetical protein